MTKAASFRYAPLRPPPLSSSSSSSGLLLAASLFPARLSILSSSVFPFHLRLRPPPLSPTPPPPRRGSSSSSSALFPARIEAKVLPLLLSAILSPPRPPPRPPPLPSSGCCSSFPFSLDRPSPTPRPAFARTNDRPGLSPGYFFRIAGPGGAGPDHDGHRWKAPSGPRVAVGFDFSDRVRASRKPGLNASPSSAWHAIRGRKTASGARD